VPDLRLASLALIGLVALPACEDDDPQDPSNIEPHQPAPRESTASPDDGPSPDTGSEAPAPRPIDVGSRLRGNIAFPQKDAEVAYQTDWYVFRGVDGQSVTFRVEATDDSQLRPMISVLTSGEGPRGDWEQVDARRAAADERSVELGVTLRSAGARLVAVDDARNVVDDREGPENPVGGEAFGYRLVVEPARGSGGGGRR